MHISACLLTLAHYLARYFTEIYFSPIVILNVSGKKVIFKDWLGRCVCLAEYARCSDDPWAKVANIFVIYIYIYIYIVKL